MTGGQFNLSFDLWKTDRYDRNRCGNDTHDLTGTTEQYDKTYASCLFFIIALGEFPRKNPGLSLIDITRFNDR